MPLAPTLYIYAAHPKHPELCSFHYVGLASTDTSAGPRSSFDRKLTDWRRARFCTARRLATLLPAPYEWEVRILEIDESFAGSKREMEDRRLFYMYWLRQHENRVLLNRRQPLAMNPTWPRTWSVLDGDKWLL